MSADNHPVERRRPLSQQERGVWREAFMAAAASGHVRLDRLTPAQAAQLCAEFGDCAVKAYRMRTIFGERPMEPGR